MAQYEHGSHHDVSGLLLEKGPICRHTLSFYQGFAVVGDAIEENDQKDTEVFPTFGLSYQYKFNKKWGLGLLWEMELAKYIIDDNSVPVFRDHVFLLALTGYWEPIHGLEFFGGPGIELEKHKNFAALLLGVEYNLYVANGWFMAPEIAVSIKEPFTTYMIGYKFNKIFGKRYH